MEQIGDSAESITLTFELGYNSEQITDTAFLQRMRQNLEVAASNPWLKIEQPKSTLPDESPQPKGIDLLEGI